MECGVEALEESPLRTKARNWWLAEFRNSANLVGFATFLGTRTRSVCLFYHQTLDLSGLYHLTRHYKDNQSITSSECHPAYYVQAKPSTWLDCLVAITRYAFRSGYCLMAQARRHRFHVCLLQLCSESSIGDNEHDADCFLIKSIRKFEVVPFGRICLSRVIVDMTHHVTHQAPMTPRPGI